ncbi:MAG: protein translocase subunit SecD [Myxococcaceae bacterium]|nr:protein translocase subunit SecD [Myxococcaceae bacterium]MBH2005945.1 protein translocase subunit SecD [Myxococcaceae bacterium]
MFESWKTRLLFSGILLGSAIYLLIPTLVYFRLDESQLREVRRDKHAFAKMLPAWSIDTHIVPGLDLQGGVHMVLGVDVEKALKDRAARTAERLKDYAKEQKMAFSDISAELLGTFASTSERDTFTEFVSKKFQELRLVSQTDAQAQFELDPTLVSSVRRDAVDQTINTIRTRIDKMGVTEPSISKRGSDKIQIQLPGFDNPEEAKSLIGRTAQLEFQMVDDKTEFLKELKDLPEGVQMITSSYGRPNGSQGKDIFLQFPEEKLESVKSYLKGKIPAENVIKFGSLGPSYLRTYTLDRKVALTGEELIDAQVSQAGEMDSRPAVSMTFSAGGARVFDELSGSNIGNRMAIVLEERVDSAPVFNTRIPSGRASITLGGGRTHEETLKDANQLTLVLKSGALPAPVTFREERSVGPSLGADSIQKGQMAFLVGSVLVILLMIFYYRISGFFSVVAVIYNLILMLAALAWLGATVTLPGIAGLLLTFGIAVDANVIINERIREELRRGKMPREAVATGYRSAFTAVFDSHVTSFIAGLVLWEFGTGPVQNFATMLIIGTVLSIFTAVFITRIFFDMVTANNPKELSI